MSGRVDKFALGGIVVGSRMSRHDRLQKLAAYGFPYALRFKLWRPTVSRVRGVVLRGQVDAVGRGMRVGAGVVIERDAGSRIIFGDGCEVREHARISAIRASVDAPGGILEVGDRTIVKRGAMIHVKSGSMRIGSRCAIGRYCELSCADTELTIGDNVRIATGVWIGTGNHNFGRVDIPIIDQGVVQRPVAIGDDVWLGTRAVVVPGVKIGRGVVVAAGAVVTRDVPDHAVVAGVPAKVVRFRSVS